MSLFKKKSDFDIVDFTALQKRGILDRAIKEQTESEQPVKISQPVIAPNQLNSASQESDMFSALDSLVGSQPLSSNKLSNSDLSSLKLKVDDLEFKLERLLEKLEALESSLNRS